MVANPSGIGLASIFKVKVSDSMFTGNQHTPYDGETKGDEHGKQ